MSRLPRSPRSTLRRSAITLAVVGALIPAAAIAAPAPTKSQTVATTSAVASAPSDLELIEMIRQQPSRVRPRTVATASRSARPALVTPSTPAAEPRVREGAWDIATTEAETAEVAAVAASDDEARQDAEATAPTPESAAKNTQGSVFATVAGQPLVLPKGVVGVGFHESGDSRALPLQPVGRPTANHNAGRVTLPSATNDPTEYFVLPTRRRANGGTTAVDIRVEPDTPVTAPVTGTVDKVSVYALYGRYRDVVMEIIPADNPELRVRVMHIQDVNLTTPREVVAGESVIAGASRQLTFASQIDRFSGRGPHLHIEVHRNTPAVAVAEPAEELAEADDAEVEGADDAAELATATSTTTSTAPALTTDTPDED